jgi:hypothetical protein
MACPVGYLGQLKNIDFSLDRLLFFKDGGKVAE